MTYGMFEVLASEDAQNQERIAGTRAVIAAQTRAKARFGSFVEKAANQEERDARISLISYDLDTELVRVSEEYGFGDIDHLRNAATIALGGGHASGCDCGFCKNKGKGFGSDKDDDGDTDDDSDDKDEKSDDDKDEKKDKKPWESSAKDVRQTTASASPFPWERVAADVETGDTFDQETVLLPSAGESGLGGPSPKIDKSKVPADGLKAIDVPSKQHPVEQQDATDRAKYDKELPGVTETGESINADTPLQPEHNVADGTETWTGTEGQASPVTSAVLAKWSVLN